MPTRFAIASGNWSSTSIWDNGALPISGDTVYSNNYTVTIDQNISVGSLRNDASGLYVQNIATPIMTSNTDPLGQAIGSGSSSGNPFYAFDQNTSTSLYWTCPTVNSGWIGYQFTTPKTIVRYAFLAWTDGLRSPYNWTFDGSNDGTNWTVLDTRTAVNTSGIWVDFLISNTRHYLYYRLNILACATAGYQPYIRELQMSETSSTVVGANAGGTFSLSSGVTITTTATTGLITGSLSTPLITYSQASPLVSYVYNLGGITAPNVGSIININNTGTLYYTGTIKAPSAGGVGLNYGINIQGGGTLIMTGNLDGSGGDGNACAVGVTQASSNFTLVGSIIAGSTNPRSNGLKITAANTVNITGDVYGGTGNANPNKGIEITGSCTSFNLTGNIYGGAGPDGAFGGIGLIVVGGGSTINITGNLITGNNAYALYNTTGSTIDITGKITANTVLPAVVSTSSIANVRVTGPMINTGGIMAIYAPKLYLKDVPIRWKMFASNLSTDRSLYSLDYNTDYPDVKDVRYNVSYNGGLMIGTMKIPDEQYVTKGIVYDGVRGGTGQLSSTEIATAVWNYSLANIIEPDSIGIRLKNVSTTDNFGATIEALN